MNALRRFFEDEQGLETVEYAVMAALITGALVGVIGLMAGAVSARFGTVAGLV